MLCCASGLLLSIPLHSVSLHAEPVSTKTTTVSASPPSRMMVQQKLMLIKMTLSSSAFFEKAASSDDEMTKQKVADVLARYANANEALKNDELMLADKAADEVLNLIEEISRSATTGEEIDTVAQRKKYESMLEDLGNSEAAYHDLLERVPAANKRASSVNIENSKVKSGKAQALANDGKFKAAIELLEDAHAEVVSAMNNLLGETALMYDIKFKSDAEEYEYELARYHSYEELAPIAYVGLKPDEFTVKLSERYVQESRNLRDSAIQLAEEGNHRAAIDKLMEAIKSVKTALRVLGLVLQE